MWEEEKEILGGRQKADTPANYTLGNTKDTARPFKDQQIIRFQRNKMVAIIVADTPQAAPGAH